MKSGMLAAESIFQNIIFPNTVKTHSDKQRGVLQPWGALSRFGILVARRPTLQPLTNLLGKPGEEALRRPSGPRR